MARCEDAHVPLLSLLNDTSLAARRRPDGESASAADSAGTVAEDGASSVTEILDPSAGDPSPDDRVRFAVTARCIAAAVFGAMEVWMLGDERALPELARLCREALESLRNGIGEPA